MADNVMKKIRFIAFATFVAMLSFSSCEKEANLADNPATNTPTEEVTFTAVGENVSKASLVFPAVIWADDDEIAVFDGAGKQTFTVVEGTNTGATADFSGKAASGADLYAVYPFSAGNALSGSSLSVTVPDKQVIARGARVDTTAIVSVGKAAAGQIEFKQICGLVKIDIAGGGIRKVILGGNALAGTVNVSASGAIESVTSGEGSIELTYGEGENFPAGTYYAAVLPGTTGAGAFSLQLVGGGGLTWQTTATSDITVARCHVLGAGEVDSQATFVRHITNKEELFAWGQVMGQESNVTVYLDDDIDCEGDPWVGTGATFDGTFEGQDYFIYNLVVNYDGDTGFISRLTGTVRDLVIGSEDGDSYDGTSCITHNGTSTSDADTHYVGLIGRMAGNALLENVTNYASIVVAATNTRAYVGGLAGLVPANETAGMKECTNYGSVTNNSSWAGAQTRMGGILGQCSGNLQAIKIKNYGDIVVNNSVTNFVGGLCGDLGSNSTVTLSSNYGAISFPGGGSQKTYIGGCFGSVRSGLIQYCRNYAPITITRNAAHWFGGIAGFMESGESTLEGCVNQPGADLTVAASVSKDFRSFMGGIAGGCQYNGSGPFQVILDSCTNGANITNEGAATDFGGIVGLLDNYYSGAVIRLQSCENTGNITSTVFDNGNGRNQELRVGGIAGGTDPETEGSDLVFNSCINRGTVSVDGTLKGGASVRVGGIIGNTYFNTVLNGCKNFGDVGCFKTGSGDAGSARFTMGGIAGYAHNRSSSRYQQFINCINTGSISSSRTFSTQYIGGIIGGGEKGDAQPYVQVSGCKNYGNISAVRTIETMVGGLCGYAIYTIANSADFGNVTGGSWNGAIVGDGNANAVIQTGICVGDAVEVTGATNASVKYTEGKKTYNSATIPAEVARWFKGWSDSAIVVTVVDQETYSE